jgi:hypothetical protein
LRFLPQNYSQVGPGMAQVRSRSRSSVFIIFIMVFIPELQSSWSWHGPSEVAIAVFCLHHLQGIMVFRASWSSSSSSGHHGITSSLCFQVMIYFKLYLFDSFYFCLKLKYLIICNNLLFKMLYQNNYFMTNKFKHLFLII